MKTALITGVGGQDGTFLAEHLLNLGYRVYGIIRKSPKINFYLRNLSDKVEFLYGDMRDELSLRTALVKSWPDEVYNLAGQVFVPTSWQVPEMTFDVNVGGLTRLLKILEIEKKDTRVYQASSSEMYGNHEGACTEKTPMNPQSPYGVSKYAAHKLVGLYRQRGMYVVSGILFNHECVCGHMPIVVRKKGLIDVLAIEELLPKSRMSDGSSSSYSKDTVGNGLEVWDGAKWSEVLTVTATRRRRKEENHNVLSVEARSGIVEVTKHHEMLNSIGKSVRAGDLRVKDKLLTWERNPEAVEEMVLTEELAELLGALVAEGSIAENGVAFTNKDLNYIDRVKKLWRMCFGGTFGSVTEIWAEEDSEYYNESNKDPVVRIMLRANSSVYDWLLWQVKTRRGFKKVPLVVLNANQKIREAFLTGYYRGDGLKKGTGTSIKTNSAVLAQGLCVLYGMSGRKVSTYVEHRGNHDYWQVNVGGDKNPRAGQHLRKDKAEIRKIVKMGDTFETAHRIESRGWVVDLETASGKFAAGVGGLVVHNSPRRGDEMVTKKIAKAVAAWSMGAQNILSLGTLDSKRDWGYAGEYCIAMHLMLQQPEPDDYVIGTGESNSVRDFLEECLMAARLSWEFAEARMKIDDRLKRQQEIFDMKANGEKFAKQTGWKPKIGLRELARMMVAAERAKLRIVQKVEGVSV